MARRRRRTTSKRTVIKNYGLMWRRDGVFWNTTSKYAEVYGRSQWREINFATQIGVYVLYDENRRPIYVGQAGQGNARLFSRLHSHTRDHLAPRWRYFSWFGLLTVNKNGSLSAWDGPDKQVRGTIRSTLDEIEGVLIAATEPPYNKQGARFKGITRYRQILDPDAEHVSMRQLYDTLLDRYTDLAEKVEVLLPAAREKRKR